MNAPCAIPPKARGFNPYPAYKDSGVEWLGEIPAHWVVKKLGYATHCLDGKRIPLNSEERGRMQGEFPYWGANGIVDYIDQWLFDEELVLLGEDGAPFFVPFKSVAFKVSGKIWVNNHIHVLRPRVGIKPGFLTYALNSVDYRAYIDGTTRDKLTQSDMNRIPIQIPPPGEQCAIASFLDCETSKIDELVAKKERLIELLREKRTALITRAVTKGLDPNVFMKDSGIEWLGNIPVHWECLAVKRRARRIQTGTTPPTVEPRYYQDGSIEWFGPSSFTDDLSLSQPVKLIAATAVTEGVARLFEVGSTMIVTIGATIGKVGFLEREGSSNQQITAVVFDNKRLVSKYAAYQIKCLEPVLRGIAPNTTLPILDQDEIGYLPLAVPPLSEQQSIVDHIDREMLKIDALITKIRGGIEKFQEYRIALISAAVTGKIDVLEEGA